MKSKCFLFAVILLTTIVNPVQAEQIEYDYYFGLYPYEHELIERYGTLPVLETSQQKENWNLTLGELNDAIKDDFAAKYMYPYGDVVTCASNSEGYFVILFRNSDVDKQLMDDIYSFMDQNTMDQEIQNIPVEFGYGDYGEKINGDMSGMVETEIQAIAEYVKSGKDINVRQGAKIFVFYGEVPKWKNKEGLEDWILTLHTIQVNSRDRIYQTEKIISSGIRCSGSMEVGIYKELPLEEKMALASETYSIIDEEARKINVTDVPVVFIEDDYVQPDEEVGEIVPTENETENTNTTPGFSALTLLTMIIMLWRFKSN